MALKLIGAGFGRTATLSLKLALEQIDYGPCYHMIEVMMNPETSVPLWMRAADGQPDWDAIFKGYTATVDFPGCTFWRELSDFYPDAKVLLSIRDPEKWFESTQATIFSEQSVQRLKQTPMKPFIEKTAWKLFGERIHDRDFMIEAFKKHNAEVQRVIPAKRLLVYEASQGWEPLCKFLGVPIPETPFPRVNSREEMTAFMSEQDQADPNAAFDPARLREALRTKFGKK